MKNGKYFILGDYKNVKLGYGTVDFKNLKTIYIKLNSWVSPNDDEDDFDSIISFSRRRIKEIVNNKKNDYFRKQSIVDLDIKSKGIKTEKKSFMNLEITLYVLNPFEIKNKQVRDFVKSLSIEIIESGLNNKNLFNFHKTKK
jgi:hypothetical protein